MNLARRCARVIAALQAAGADDECVADPVVDDSTGLPPREIAQDCLNRIYEDLELRAALRSALAAQYALL